MISDPSTHPDWWPDVLEVEVNEPLVEGGEYSQTSKHYVGEIESVWIAERMEDLKEAHFRCTLSGTYARFALTPTREGTFVEVETGIRPTNLRWRLEGLIGRSYFKRWLTDVLDALPEAVERARARPEPSRSGG